MYHQKLIRLFLAISLIGFTGCENDSVVNEGPTSNRPVTVKPIEAIAAGSALTTLVQIDDVPAGNYAVWWTTKNTPSFLESKCYRTLDRIYERSKGVESRILASFLADLEANDIDVKRMAYPESLTIFAKTNRQPLIITISQEKGIRFHFETTSCPSHYRDQFLDEFAEEVERLRKSTLNANQELDEKWEPNAFDWWTLVKVTAENQEIDTFGLLKIE